MSGTFPSAAGQLSIPLANGDCATGGLKLGTVLYPSCKYQSGGIDADRVNADQHLLIAQHLGTTELMQSNRLHCISRRSRVFAG